MKSMTAYKTQCKGKVIAAEDGILILEPETVPATEPIAIDFDMWPDFLN
jgi:hypothetical protein